MPPEAHETPATSHASACGVGDRALYVYGRTSLARWGRRMCQRRQTSGPGLWCLKRLYNGAESTKSRRAVPLDK